MRTFKSCAVFFALAAGVGVCPSVGVAAAQTDHTLPILWHAQGATKYTWFGMNAAGIGDINHDGFDDIAVVSLADHKTFVYFGGVTPDTVPDLRLPTLFYSITRLGDINGDGYPDIAGSNGTTVYIFHGKPTSLDTIPDDSLVPDVRGTGFGGGFGIGLAAADFDHDGLLDFVVVDESPGLPGSIEGRILFYSGADGYGSHVRWAIPGPDDTHRYVNCLAIDLDGDSLPELVVTALGSETKDLPGRVMVFDSSPFDSIPDFQFFCPPVVYPRWKYSFGSVLSDIGDFNHDGHEDLAIPAGTQGFVFYGGPGIWDSIPDLQFNTCVEKIAPAGDINADGICDVIVGDVCYNAREGRGEIFLGGHPPDGEVDYWMGYEDLPKHYEEKIGYVVAPAGDFNGDGVDDVILVSQNIADWFYGDVFVLGGIKYTSVGDSSDGPVAGGGTAGPSLTLDVYPNPSNANITLRASLSRPANLNLCLYDILGRKVALIVDASLAEGSHTYQWRGIDQHGKPLSSGVYFAVAQTERMRAAKRVILLK